MEILFIYFVYFVQASVATQVSVDKTHTFEGSIYRTDVNLLDWYGRNIRLSYDDITSRWWLNMWSFLAFSGRGLSLYQVAMATLSRTKEGLMQTLWWPDLKPVKTKTFSVISSWIQTVDRWGFGCILSRINESCNMKPKSVKRVLQCPQSYLEISACCRKKSAPVLISSLELP
jgi:hypothetical protein